MVAFHSSCHHFHKVWLPCQPVSEVGNSWRTLLIERWSSAPLWNHPLEYRSHHKTWLQAQKRAKLHIAATMKKKKMLTSVHYFRTFKGEWGLCLLLRGLLYRECSWAESNVCMCKLACAWAYVSTEEACRSRCRWPHRSGLLGRRAHIQVSNCSSHCCPIQSHCPAVPRYWWQGAASRSPLGKKNGEGTGKQEKVFKYMLSDASSL